MTKEIERQLNLIRGFIDAAEGLLKDEHFPDEIKSPLLEGYARDVVGCAENLKTMAKKYHRDESTKQWSIVMPNVVFQVK